MDIFLGQIVRSKAGRDKGRWFLITGYLDEDHVLIVDGDLRKLEKPKKKKIKHLEFCNKVDFTIKDKLTKNLKITNSEIRKILAEYKNQIGNNTER